MNLLAAAALLALLGQAAESGFDHLRYERPVTVASNSPGPACAVLDAAVFAHASAQTLDDVRLYATPRDAADTQPREIPFALTISSAAPAEVAHVPAENLRLQAGRLGFDLRMPARPYSEVLLDLDATNFVATAQVTAPDPTHPEAPPRSLGEFTLFDLSAQHLARWTTLSLAETSARTLHVQLRLRTPAGAPLPAAPAIVRGADVPASRLAQTLYTTVATTSDLHAGPQGSEAVLHVPPHVPVERVQVVLDPAFRDNFARRLSLTAYPGPSLPHPGRLDTPPGREQVESSIWRENLTPPGAPAVHQEHLSVDAVLAATLRDQATVRVAIDAASQPALPVRAVELAMRQRRLCFLAEPGQAYTVRYGDPGLSAPVYDMTHLFDRGAAPVDATLGPETPNPRWQPRPRLAPTDAPHPNLLWVVLLSIIAVLGAIAIGSLKHQRRIR